MASIFEFQLQGKTYSLMIFYAEPEHFYVLEDGSLLPVSVRPAWCESCQKFVPGEQIFPIEEEDTRLEELEYFAEHPGHIPSDRDVSLRNLPERRVRRKWRHKRTSPAKCLVCGSASITLIWPGSEVEIPGRGKCAGGFSGFADAYNGGRKELFTPEGERVRSTPTHPKRGAR